MDRIYMHWLKQDPSQQDRIHPTHTVFLFYSPATPYTMTQLFPVFVPQPAIDRQIPSATTTVPSNRTVTDLPPSMGFRYPSRTLQAHPAARRSKNEKYSFVFFRGITIKPERVLEPCLERDAVGGRA